MYLMPASFPGVIKGLWAARTNDHKCTFMSTLIMCSSITFVRRWEGVDAYLRPREPQRAGRPRLLQPSGSSTLIWQETQAVTSFLQVQGGVGSLLWSLSTWVTGSFVTRVPPLRIPAKTFLVIASSYGRCGGTTENSMLWKTASVFCTIKKASYYKTHGRSLEKTFRTPLSHWLTFFSPLWVFACWCFAFIPFVYFSMIWLISFKCS